MNAAWMTVLSTLPCATVLVFVKRAAASHGTGASAACSCCM